MRYGLEERTIEALHHIFEENQKISKVVIYGSRAKGINKKGSDIDLCIMDKDFMFEDRIDLGVAIDDLMLPYTVDLSIYSSLQNKELIRHIDRVGEVFYHRATCPD